MLVEHARNLMGIADAVHGEYGVPGTQVVTALACSLADNEIVVQLRRGSRLRDLYDADAVREKTTCNYGLNPDFASIASSAGMQVAAIDDTGEVRAVERADHPFFFGTLFQPQLTSLPGAPHPVWVGFIRAVVV